MSNLYFSCVWVSTFCIPYFRACRWINFHRSIFSRTTYYVTVNEWSFATSWLYLLRKNRFSLEQKVEPIPKCWLCFLLIHRDRNSRFLVQNCKPTRIHRNPTSRLGSISGQYTNQFQFPFSLALTFISRYSSVSVIIFSIFFFSLPTLSKLKYMHYDILHCRAQFKGFFLVLVMAAEIWYSH